jgi:hypothetical protein
MDKFIMAIGNMVFKMERGKYGSGKIIKSGLYVKVNS